MLRHSKSVTLFLDINYGSVLPSFPSTACLSLSISPHNRDPCPILHRVTSETDFRDFSPRFPNDSHAKARFCSLPTCWWSQSWSCTRYQTCKTLLFSDLKKRSFCFQATNVFSNSMTCSPTKGRELSVDGQRENCIIPLPAYCPHPYYTLLSYVLSMSILYLDLVALHILYTFKPNSFATFPVEYQDLLLMYVDGQIAFLMINCGPETHISAFRIL